MVHLAESMPSPLPVSPEYMVLHGRHFTSRRRWIPWWSRLALWGFIAYVGVNLVFVILTIILANTWPPPCWPNECRYLWWPPYRW